MSATRDLILDFLLQQTVRVIAPELDAANGSIQAVGAIRLDDCKLLADALAALLEGPER